MTVLHLGALGRDQELILIALVVGMAASGAVLLSAVPSAAFSYMSGILIPGAVKCLILLDHSVYLLLGVLALSYWWFLAALIVKIAREITERKQAEEKLHETEGKLRRLLGALTSEPPSSRSLKNPPWSGVSRMMSVRTSCKSPMVMPPFTASRMKPGRLRAVGGLPWRAP